MIEPWYDLVSALPTQLGESLAHWSENSQGAPMFYIDQYGESVDTKYAEELASRGDALIKFGAAKASGDEPSPQLTALAKEALHWVADHLEEMWD